MMIPVETPPTQVQKKFDLRAAHYDNPLTAWIGELELMVIRRFVPPASKVLDYGCGTGRTTLDLLRRGCEVTAYDISAAMLSIARARSETAGFQAEFTTDPATLAGKTWPIITCIGVFDYYPDPLPLFNSLRPLLAEGGMLVITFPNALSPLSWAYAAGSRLTCPATPRTPAFIHRAARTGGFSVRRAAYAFPAIKPFGHTLVLSLTRI